MKKMVSLLTSLFLLLDLFVLPVAADEVATTAAFSEDVVCSITDSNLSGLGLAFCFTLNADGVLKNEVTHATDLSAATLSYEGKERKIARIGALITNQADWGTDTTRFVRSAVLDDGEHIKDVSADKMYKVFETSCSFAILLTNIPFEKEERLVYVRPYVELLCDSEKVTLYAETIASNSYAAQAGEPSVSIPYYGTDVDGKGRLLVGETAVIGSTLYLEIVDELDEWMTIDNPADPDLVYYACYDKDGNELTLDVEDYGCLYIRDMSSFKATETFEIELPEGTAKVRIVGADIVYWSEWEEVD